MRLWTRTCTTKLAMIDASIRCLNETAPPPTSSSSSSPPPLTPRTTEPAEPSSASSFASLLSVGYVEVSFS